MGSSFIHLIRTDSNEFFLMVGYSHLFKNLPQFVVIHTSKLFSIVNEAGVDELFCFLHDPMGVINLISGSSACSKLRWLSGKESACQVEDAGSITRSVWYPGTGNGNPPQYSCLGNPMDRGTWQATVLGGHKESDTTWRLKQQLWKLQVYNIVIHNFKGNSSFIVIIKYWLYSLWYILVAYFVQNNLYHLIPYPYIAPSLSLSHLKPLVCSLYLWVYFFFVILTSLLYFLDPTHQWYHTVFVFLTHFTYNNALKVLPCCWKWQNFVFMTE